MSNPENEYWKLRRRKKQKNSKRFSKNEHNKYKRKKKGIPVKELRVMDYGDYLRTEHWKSTAKRRRRIDNNRCANCGEQWVMLEVHHLTYRRRGRERMKDLITLCSKCHSREHHRLDALKREREANESGS